MRLIDADALAKAFRDMAESVVYIQKDRTYWSESLISAAEEVDDAPTVDAVAVVRCKDCKHWYNDADTGTACEFTNLGQPPDGYCNWGERRSE